MSRPGLVFDLSDARDASEASLAGDGRHAGAAEAAGRLAEAPDAVIITSPPPPIAALARMASGRGLRAAALVPNMTSYSHDASEQGLVGAAVARLRRSGPRTVARVVATGLRDARGALRMELAVVAKVLIELDLHELRALRPTRIVLAAPLTDVALAARNGAFFHSYVRHVSRTLRAEPWLETWNPGHLLRAIREWGADVTGIVAPVNARGYMMRPDLETCVAEIRRTRVAIWARDVTAAGSLDFDEGVAFAESLGAAAVVVPAPLGGQGPGVS